LSASWTRVDLACERPRFLEKEPNVSIIIGCDFHPGYQQIAMMDMDSEEFNEKTLSHQKQEEVRTFYLTLHCSVALAVRLYLAEVGKWLRSVIQGYFNYHAVPGNFASLQRFRREVSKRWLRVLQRRSQKSRMSWKHLTGFAE